MKITAHGLEFEVDYEKEKGCASIWDNGSIEITAIYLKGEDVTDIIKEEVYNSILDEITGL
jgi:hypothetical protein